MTNQCNVRKLYAERHQPRSLLPDLFQEKKKEKLEHHPCLFAKRLRSIHPNQKDQQPSADLSSTNQQVTGFSPWYKQYLYISDKFEFLSVVEHHMYFLNTHIHHIYSLCLKVLRSI